MKKARIPVISAVLVLAVLAAPGCRKRADGENRISVSGVIEAVKTDIQAQAQGEVETVAVKEGQKVAKGDLLCTINADKLKIQLDQVRAGIAGATARRQLARIGTKKELIAMAKTQVEITAKQLEIAEKDQQRFARLLAEGAVSQTQKEKADLALKAAQEQAKGAKDNYDMAVRGREKEEIDMTQADLDGLLAQEQYLLRALKDTEVRSPGTGIVEVKSVEPGELASPGTVLFSLIDLSQTYVKAYVPEKYLGRLKLGASVAVSCDSYPGRAFGGAVDFISSEAEFAPKNVQTTEERLKLVYMVKSYLPNEAGELKPGMPVDVAVTFAK
jgi:HlyD family secretion protein